MSRPSLQTLFLFITKLFSYGEFRSLWSFPNSSSHVIMELVFCGTILLEQNSLKSVAPWARSIHQLKCICMLTLFLLFGNFLEKTMGCGTSSTPPPHNHSIRKSKKGKLTLYGKIKIVGHFIEGPMQEVIA